LKNLWPQNLNLAEDKATPKELLQEQANLLSKVTNSKLQASVETVTALKENTFENQKIQDDFDIEVFIHTLRIIVPALNYRFTLLRLAHSTIKLNPFYVYSVFSDEKFEGNTVEDLEKILEQIFNSDAVKDALNTIILQSNNTNPF